MTTPTTDDLPPLPGHLGFADVVRAAGPVYTADQMREYARAAIQQAAVPEETQEQIESLDDLVTFVRRLVHALHKAAPDEVLTDHAVDYLQRKGFNKGPFRSAAAPAPTKQQPALGRGEGGGLARQSFYLRNSSKVFKE